VIENALLNYDHDKELNVLLENLNGLDRINNNSSIAVAVVVVVEEEGEEARDSNVWLLRFPAKSNR